jgi:hypothetical protein
MIKGWRWVGMIEVGDKPKKEGLVYLKCPPAAGDERNRVK